MLAAAGSTMFLIPNEIAPSGFTGIASILHSLFSWPIGTVMLLLNVPFFYIAYREYGKTFFVRTMYCLVLYSLCSDIFPEYALSRDALLASVYGGILFGAGIGCVLLGGGTTGGSELLAKLIVLKAKGLSVGKLVFLVDCCVIAAACFVFGVEASLYAVISLFITSKMIDLITNGMATGRAFYIISKKSGEIAREVINKLERGSTFFYARGAYTDREIEVLLCIVQSRTETVRLKEIVSEVDADAFMIGFHAQEVLGYGFLEENLQKKS